MKHPSHRRKQGNAGLSNGLSSIDLFEERLVARRNLPISELDAALQRVQSSSLVEALASLQLVPANACHSFSLDVATHRALAIPGSRRNRISRRALRAFIREGIPETIRLEDDPPEESFTVPIPFFDGDHVLISGWMAGQLPLLRDVLRVLYQSPSDTLQALGEHVFRPVRGLLLIADELCRRSGLSRYCLPPLTRPPAIVVPDDVELQRLRNAVRIPMDEIESLLASKGLTLADVERFRLEDSLRRKRTASSVPPSFLYERPLCARDREVILPVPGAVGRALLGFIWREADSAHVADELLNRVGHVQISGAIESLRALYPESRPLNVRPPSSPPGLRTREIVCQVESDRFAYLMHAIPLADEAALLGPRFVRRATDVSAELRVTHPHLSNGLGILLSSARGDEEWTQTLWFKPPSALACFAIDVHDLGTLAVVGDQDSSLLTKALATYERISRHLILPPFSFLDVVDAFLKGPRHIADAIASGTQFCIPPGGGGRLRMQADVALDRHLVRGRPGDSWVEVERLYRRSPLGLYRRNSVKGVELWVEAGSPASGFWVISPEAHIDEQDGLWRVCDAVAFWIWRFIRSGSLRAMPDVTTVEVHRVRTGEAAKEGLTALRVSEAHVEIRVGLFPPTDGQYSEDPDALIVHELSHVFGVESNIEFAALRSSPEHRRVLVSNVGDDPTLDPRGIPFAIGVHDYDLKWTTALGAVARTRAGLTRKAALDAQVSSLFSELTQLLSELKADEALPAFVVTNEAIIHRRAASAHSISGRRSDPDLSPDLLKEVAEDEMAMVRSGPAARFVIEILAAKQPTGGRRISQSVVDEAVTLAATIIQLGAESDAVHFGVALRGPDASPSVFTTDLAEAMVRTFLTKVNALVASPGEGPSAGRRTPLAMDELARATLSEFGFSFEDYGRLVGLFLDRSIESRPEPHWMSMDDLCRLGDRVGLSDERIDALIRGLSLTERPEFLKPPAPFRAEDVYPWRLNRELSFIRRPLVLRGSGRETRIFTGHRHLALSAQHLAERVVAAQITARTPEMQRYIDRRQNELSREFVEEVAGQLGSVGCIVRKNLKKVGGLRVADDSRKDLGDFDVVALLPSRRHVLLLECKRVALARSPFELALSWKTFLGTPDNPGEFFSKVKGREKWARRHTDAFQREFARYLTPSDAHLKLTSRIVVEREFVLSFFPEAASRITWVSALLQEIRRGDFDE